MLLINELHLVIILWRPDGCQSTFDVLRYQIQCDVFWLCRNVLDVIAYTAQIGIAVVHLGRYALTTNVLSVVMALQVLVLWVKIQYFARYTPQIRNQFVYIWC